MWRWFERLRPYRGWAVLALLLGVVTIAANLGLTATAAYLIARAAQHPETILLLWVPIVGVRFFGTLRGVARYGDRYFSHDVTFRTLKDLRVAIYRRLEPVSPVLLKRAFSGDLWARFGADVETLQNAYLNLFSPTVVALAGIVLAAGLGWFLNPQLGATLLVMLLAAAVVVPWTMDRLAARSAGALVSRRAELSQNWFDWVYGLSDLMALSAEAQVTQWHEAFLNRWRHLVTRLNRLKGWVALTNEAVNQAVLWAALWVAVGLVVRRQLPPVDLAVAAFLAYASFEAVRPLAGAFQMRAQVARAQERIEHLPDGTSRQVVTPGAAKTPACRPAAFRSVAITLDQVWFRYQSTDPWVLEDASLAVAPGDSVAIIGESGAGKSTLFHLLLGFVVPNRGQIWWDGTPLTAPWHDRVQPLIAAMPQRPHLFVTTLRQNLLLAAPSASDEELWQVLQRVQLAEWVRHLPQGLDTPVGEHGQQLSGGQQKRLALARVYLKDAPLILLDEPTEGLDAHTADSVLKAFWHWATDKTVIWISHDVRWLHSADRVVELHHGRFREWSARAPQFGPMP
jgi:ATP-binding cassette subfamily C protein CydC